MSIKRNLHLVILALLSLSVFSCKSEKKQVSEPTVEQTAFKLEKVAESSYQWTGITLSKENRMFVNYPTWGIASPFKVAEIIDGKEVAYPSDSINQLFTCVQSVVIDDLNRMWVLDPANPQFGGVVESGAKLFLIDLATNAISKTFVFPTDVAPKDSYLNDVRVDTKKGLAYMTDSELGGIVVLDINTGKSWRAIDNTSDAVKANLTEIDFVSTGKFANRVNSDGIELSKDGNTLYFTALTGNILYQVPTSVLADTTITVAQRSAKVSVLNKENVPTDGMWLKNDTLYMADLPNEGLFAVDVKTGKGNKLAIGQTVRWADSFAQDNEGNIYFTTSQINYPQDKLTKFEIYKLTK